MYASEVLLDVLDAIDITPNDLPKIPIMTIPHPQVIIKNRNAFIILSVGLLGFTVYLFATSRNSSKEEKKTQEEST